ncbi:MAG: hypothetical protein K6G24_07865 [Lachnospiraceae bacterium]|nr:hypothetical protein [Lachnospiraceae bacterium]
MRGYDGMIGAGTFRPYAINTFSGRGASLGSDMHYVHPHHVSAYVRSDGTSVSGYWRDGDGNTLINRPFGWFQHNPNSLK